MVLSNDLFNAIANKLKLKTSLLNEERLYVENLLNKIDHLKKLREDNYKTLSVKKTTYQKNIENDTNLIVMYIISISFLKANTTIHVSDVKGNIKLFYSAGSVGLGGKQKKKRLIAVSKLISLMLKKAIFLGKKPVALHLNNVNFYNSLIVNKLKKSLYIKVIKSFNQTPYNRLFWEQEVMCSNHIISNLYPFF